MCMLFPGWPAALEATRAAAAAVSAESSCSRTAAYVGNHGLDSVTKLGGSHQDMAARVAHPPKGDAGPVHSARQVGLLHTQAAAGHHDGKQPTGCNRNSTVGVIVRMEQHHLHLHLMIYVINQILQSKPDAGCQDHANK